MLLLLLLLLRVVARATLLSVALLAITRAASTVPTTARASVAVAVVLTLGWSTKAALWIGVRCAALPNLGAAPWRNARAASSDIVSSPSSPWCPPTVSARPCPRLPQLRHQAGVLGVEAALDHVRVGATPTSDVCCVRVPVDGAVASHVSSTAADTTYDVRCKVTLLGAVVFAMANATTVLANLVLVVAESTV